MIRGSAAVAALPNGCSLLPPAAHRCACRSRSPARSPRSPPLPRRTPRGEPRVQRATSAGVARDGARPADSPFRRRWSRRTQIWVVIAGWVLAAALRLLYLTLRVRLLDRGEVFARRRRGEQVLAAFWHDGIVLLPLVVTRLRWPGTVNVMLSWHRDAEIAAQAMRRLGIRAVRGSATRGWLGGLRGLLAARARGEDIVIVPDGPRGPRHEAKDGALEPARAPGLPLVVVGAARSEERRVGKGWGSGGRRDGGETR